MFIVWWMMYHIIPILHAIQEVTVYGVDLSTGESLSEFGHNFHIPKHAGHATQVT